MPRPNPPAMSDWLAECESHRAAKLAEWSKTLAPGSRDPFQHGWWRVAYQLIEAFDRPSLSDLALHMEVAPHADRSFGFGHKDHRPERVYDQNAIVHWDTVPTRDLYWRACTHGSFYMVRDYQADRDPHRLQVPPGEAEYGKMPVWRIADCLRHAEHMAAKLVGGPASVHFHCLWTSLRGRTLVDEPPPLDRKHVRADFGSDTCPHPEVSSEATISTADITQDLPTATLRLTKPFYDAFKFDANSDTFGKWMTVA